MNKQIVDRWFNRYPKLEIFIAAGTVSLKMARSILLIDRYEMYDIFLELVEAQAVYPSGSNCWRATPELKAYVEERAKQRNSEEEK